MLDHNIIINHWISGPLGFLICGRSNKISLVMDIGQCETVSSFDGLSEWLSRSAGSMPNQK